MKHLITCCMLTLSLAGWGQLQFASNSAEVYFPPTTVDSTSTFPVVIINELSLPQTVSSGRALRTLSPAISTEVLVPANDTTSIALSFTPDSVSAFADTLICSGNVFGTDTLYRLRRRDTSRSDRPRPHPSTSVR